MRKWKWKKRLLNFLFPTQDELWMAFCHRHLDSLGYKRVIWLLEHGDPNDALIPPLLAEGGFVRDDVVEAVKRMV